MRSKLQSLGIYYGFTILFFFKLLLLAPGYQVCSVCMLYTASFQFLLIGRRMIYMKALS